MLMPIRIPSISSDERSRLLSVDEMRLRALERLYQRRDTVSQLIQSLEDYQRLRKIREARMVEFSVAH